MTKEEQIQELAEIIRNARLRFDEKPMSEVLAQLILDAGYTKSPEIKLTLISDKEIVKIMGSGQFDGKTNLAIPIENSNSVMLKRAKALCQAQLSHNEQEVEKSK
jgi:hypothetical protein